MTDEELVLKYVNRFYEVSVTESLKFVNKITSVVINENDFKDEITSVFKGLHTALSTAQAWYQEKIVEIIGDFKVLLDGCSVFLGISSWEVRHPIYGKIDSNRLTSYYFGDKKIPYWLVNTYFDEWYENKIIEATESAMNNYW